MAILARLLTPVAAACALYASVAAPGAQAATVVNVTNCNDSGPGSLRSGVFGAPDGAVIDLRTLGCTRIALTSGAITVTQNNLQLLGRSRYALMLDGNKNDRILQHTGSGLLRLSRLSIMNGRNVENFAKGGCVSSEANLLVEFSSVSNCRAEGVRNPDDECETCPMGASGGALFAHYVKLVHTTVSNSRADSFDSRGGGVYATRRLTMFNSRLTGNVAMYGAGAFAGNEFTAHDSLIDHNGFDFAETYAEQGAIYVFDLPRSPGQAVLVRSAVVDNDARGCTGVCVEGRGWIVNSTVARNQGGPSLWFRNEGFISNSTVAVNSESTGVIDDPSRCAGAVTTPQLMLESSIIALNRCGSNYALDLAAGTISGSHNLVQWSRSRLPADSLRVDPKLQSLRNDGGPTPTMALLDGSVAINRGANPLGLKTDQRGGRFARVGGSSADIGAYEYQSP